MVRYPLTYLFQARTVDGKVWMQTPEDVSQRFPELKLIDPETQEDGYVLDPKGVLPEEVAVWEQVRAGLTRVTFLGREWLWRRRSAWSDLEDYNGRGEITDFRLVAPRDINRWVRVLLRDLLDSRGEVLYRRGDLLLHAGLGSRLVHVPNPYPSGMLAEQALRVEYARDVTVTTTDFVHHIVNQVWYVVGWSCEVDGAEHRHRLRLQGETE